MYLAQGTIELKVSLFKFLIALLLGGNTGLLGFLLRFVWKNYRKYKNAFMMYIEEHEKLVEDYIRRHPEEIDSYPNYFSRISRNTKKQHSGHGVSSGIRRHLEVKPRDVDESE